VSLLSESVKDDCSVNLSVSTDTSLQPDVSGRAAPGLCGQGNAPRSYAVGSKRAVKWRSAGGSDTMR
jgi:hypothetical protein